MRLITHPSCRVVGAGLFPSSVGSPLSQAHRRVSIAGGGRGDLFKRHAAQYKAPWAGAARGIRHLSESTEPQDGQLHIRKLRSHIAYDHKYSGGGHHRPAIAAWSYIVPSLRKNVEVACTDVLYNTLLAGEVALSTPQQQQLREAQNLFRFELQQRIGLLEDSLAEAELSYLIQWPSLFQRVWLRLPVHLSKPGEGAAEYASNSTSIAVAFSASSCSSLAPSSAAPLPISTTVWASTTSSVASTLPATATATGRAPSSAGPDRTGSSFQSRLDRLTRHVVEFVEGELKALEMAAPSREDGAPRSRRQVALEAAWRAQWRSAVQWHLDELQ
ncbi:putative mitochondrial hypothetical protein [Leptomonas pyrrhocoris]|uniref:Uncharacterized protein n=1 Tax=Leptomonas pyrrhocoris TaxID=157538 RepID=A0A0M9FVK4_LEPPY|nr:putative mitochondrial hypothetical protein [Leptomonas pyrrhocoris]KPA76776.1 putative mitochondrial hypothetical protein [Leptomonas pyrrhocoris]|eukprot:XP_015655215.1 putative mitochondrial hypothetical protein [Leptomonas pyrrhocoris]